jgi:hypothetical protein
MTLANDKAKAKAKVKNIYSTGVINDCHLRLSKYFYSTGHRYQICVFFSLDSAFVEMKSIFKIFCDRKSSKTQQRQKCCHLLAEIESDLTLFFTHVWKLIHRSGSLDTIQGQYSQHFIFFVTYEWPQQARAFVPVIPAKCNMTIWQIGPFHKLRRQWSVVNMPQGAVFTTLY